MFTLHDPADNFRNQCPPDDKEVKCHCGWSGIIGQCREERYRSSPDSWEALAGRDGWVYKCPKCQNVLDSYFWCVS